MRTRIPMITHVHTTRNHKDQITSCREGLMRVPACYSVTRQHECALPRGRGKATKPPRGSGQNDQPRPLRMFILHTSNRAHTSPVRIICRKISSRICVTRSVCGSLTYNLSITTRPTTYSAWNLSTFLWPSPFPTRHPLRVSPDFDSDRRNTQNRFALGSR